MISKLILLFAALAHAMPSSMSIRPRWGAPASELTFSPSFSLLANVTRPHGNINPQNYHVAALHNGVGSNIAVLLPEGAVLGLESFYRNGTKEELDQGKGDLVSTHGMPVNQDRYIPFALQVSASGVDATITISAGTGTRGFTVQQSRDDVATVWYNPETAASTTLRGGYLFWACKATLSANMDTLRLVAPPQTDLLPEGCAEITLLPQCAGSLPEQAVSQFSTEGTSCYVDARM